MRDGLRYVRETPIMLATFVGLEVIRKVSPLLHTPLMSLTNAISAISVMRSVDSGTWSSLARIM